MHKQQLECTLCKKQSVSQAETHFNIQFDNHRSDVSEEP